MDLLVLVLGSILASKVISGNAFSEQWKQENFCFICAM